MENKNQPTTSKFAIVAQVAYVRQLRFEAQINGGATQDIDFIEAMTPDEFVTWYKTHTDAGWQWPQSVDRK